MAPEFPHAGPLPAQLAAPLAAPLAAALAAAAPRAGTGAGTGGVFGAGGPAISVITSVYNGAAYLAEAIDSVLRQSFADFEFLILDDGSTDASAAIIREHAARDARIRPIFRENRGLVASLNQLLAEARAPLVARMDADDICHPERFRQQKQFLDEHGDYGALGTRCEDIDQHGQPWPLAYPPHPLTHDAFLLAIERGEPLLCHPSAMYRRELVLGIGGYRPAFRHCEDYDLWLRLARVTRLGNLAQPLLRYRHYSDQVSSRHATAIQTGAAIAKLCYDEARSARPDPVATLPALPAVDDLDTVFGREGVARAVRAVVAPRLLHAPTALRDEGFGLILRHVRDGQRPEGIWRTVARLLRLGEPWRAVRLAVCLALV